MVRNNVNSDESATTVMKPLMSSDSTSTTTDEQPTGVTEEGTHTHHHHNTTRTSTTSSYSFLSGYFDSAHHRYIFAVWTLLVVALNMGSSLVVTSTRPKTPMRYVDSWPPRDVMQGLVDRSNRVVVVIVEDDADVELADNFISSLERSGVYNFAIVPLHQASYDALSVAYPHNILPPMPTVDHWYVMPSLVGQGQGQLPRGSSSGGTMTKIDADTFEDVVSIRPNILHAFAKAGYTFFSGDVNSVWRTNAFLEINQILDVNAQWGTNLDALFLDDSKDDNTPRLSSTQMFLKPTPATLDFLERWVRYRDDIVWGDDRHAFNGIVQRYATTPEPVPYRTTTTTTTTTGNNDDVPRELSTLTLRFDENKEFRVVIGEKERYPPGWMYYGKMRLVGGGSKHALTDQQRQDTAIVHNGLAGKDNTRQKVARLESVGLWRPSGRLRPPQ